MYSDGGLNLITIEYEGVIYERICETCWNRMLTGVARFIHPSWLSIHDMSAHELSHRHWLDLNDDEKECRVADILGNAGIREQQEDGSWKTLSSDDIRFA